MTCTYWYPVLRRITLAIEFTKPDQLLRERIWRSMKPPKLQVSEDVDFLALARKYELPGGFIKNAWLTALSIAVAREGVNPTVTQARELWKAGKEG